MKLEEKEGITLYYRLDCTIPFDVSDPVIGEDTIGSFKLENDILIVHLSDEYRLLREARRIVDPILKSWQLEAEICYRMFNFRFAFWKAEMETSALDNDDNPPEALNYEKDEKGQLVIYSTTYPPFPQTRFTTEMVAAWVRYRKASMGIGESIQSAAYYALTIAESVEGKGKRKMAATKLQIDEKILGKIGELTSKRGSINTARKSLGTSAKDLTKKEKCWIECAVRFLMFHLGLVNSGEIPTKITMSDLPVLDLQ